jgi:hypothetical protein
MDNDQQKINHLKALYHLASIDKDISEVETIYIRNVAERFGIDASELEKFDGSEPVLDLPNREYKVYTIFHRLAIIIMIDGHLDEQERNFCFNIGIKMGLHPNAVGEIVSLVEKKGSSNMLPSEVMTIFKKYLN